MAIREFRLPDPGEGLVEADIVTWRVAVGDQVKINDIVVEVETSKSLVELPSPYAGTVTALLVAEGETVDGRLADHRHRRRGRGASRRTPATRRHGCPEWPELDEPEDGDGAGRAGGHAGRLRAQDHRGQAAAAQATAADPEREQAHAMLAGTFATDAPVSRRADEREPLDADQRAADRRTAAGARPGRARAACSAVAQCWPSRRCASWPRTSGST